MPRRGLAPIFIIVIVAAVLALGGGALYYAKKISLPKPVACTQDAKQCPDGSYVGRTGPNCEFAACPTEIPNSTKSGGTGILRGQVTIGPNCPVERIDNPCVTPPEAYATREFLVTQNGKTVTTFHADTSGNYIVSLAPGSYTVTSAKTGIGFMSKDLPHAVAIQAGRTVTLNIDVDTGIR